MSEERDKRLEEYSYRVWVAVHTPGRVSKEVIFEAIREQWERAERAEAENEALRASNEGMRQQQYELEDRVDALRADRDRLREVLAPFAAYYHPSQSRLASRLDGRMLSRRYMPDENGYESGAEIGITAADFAAARALASGEESRAEEPGR